MHILVYMNRSDSGERRPLPMSPKRLAFINCLKRLSTKPEAEEHYIRWAEQWTKARGHESPERTTQYFEALSKGTSIIDWQYRQAVEAAHILAVDVMQLPWATGFNWSSISDQARNLPQEHRTHARETIRVPSVVKELPAIGEDGIISEAEELPATILVLRRAMRLRKMAVATEQAYVGWNARFIRFCHRRLNKPARLAGPDGVTEYLNYLVLHRQVAASTQKQALNAMVFLLKRVFGIEEFDLDINHARQHRRPPVVMTRQEVQSVFAHLEDPWKLIAQVMYGSGLRLMEAMQLRVKDIDFGQGNIAIHDAKGGKHRMVPLPRALEERLRVHLEKEKSKHEQDLASGHGEVHLPESFLRKTPGAARKWCWPYMKKGRLFTGRKT